MKEVINGKLYNTEDSVLVIDNGKGIGENNRGLYRTKKGNWFKVYFNGLFNDHILPLTNEESRNILGLTSVEKYIEYFDNPENA